MIRILILLLSFPIFLSAQNKLDYKINIINGLDTDLQTLKDGNINTGWFPGWNQGDYPVRALIKFNNPVYLSRIRVFDWVGKPNFRVYSGDKKIIDKTLSLYGSFQDWAVTTDLISEIIIQITDIQGDRPITEIECYGSTKKPDPEPTPLKSYYGDASKIGVNGFHWVPIELNPTANLRMYQMSQWTWTMNGIMVEPTFEADGMYDSYLSDAKKNNKEIIFCINKIPKWFGVQIGDNWADQRFHLYGKNSTDPLSYIEFAEYAWQIVARYGSKTYPSNLLKVNKNPRWNNDQINVEKSGLNLIRYIEFENEADRPWNSPLYQYTPYELAAMMSALWDGHEGSMGKYVGIKSADPNVKLVLPGLSNINLWYLGEMNKWFKANRKDKRFCADVINVHHYSNSKNPWPGYLVDLTGRGVRPDFDHLDIRLKELKQFVNDNIDSTLPIWFSEFGYDTYLPATFLSQYPELYLDYTSEQLQGQWLLRTYLISLASGMDKIFMFNLCDEDSFDKGYCFGSSGLLSSESTSYKRKLSWYDIDWLMKELNGFRYVRDESFNGITIYKFTNKTHDKFFYWTNGQPKSIIIGSKKIVVTDKVQSYKNNKLLYWNKIKINNVNNK